MPTDPILAFLRVAAEHMVDAGEEEPLATRAIQFSVALTEAERKEVAPSTVPSIAHLDMLNPDPLIDAFRAAAPLLPFTEVWRIGDGGVAAALADLKPCLRDFPLALGIMVVSPHSVYPEHSHKPAETYVVIGGRAQWRYGGCDEYRWVDPGAVLVNEVHDVHGVRTSADPVVALYVLFD